MTSWAPRWDRHGCEPDIGVTVVSVKAEGQEDFTYADAETVLRYGDEILVVGRLEDLERFAGS